MKYLSAIFVQCLVGALLFLGSIHSGWAMTDGPCYPTPSTHQFHFNFGTYPIKNKESNTPGVLLDDMYEWHSGDEFQGYCECNTQVGFQTATTKFKTESPLPQGHTSGFYKINDYLEFTMSIYFYQAPNGGKYFPLPINNISNNDSEPCYRAIQPHTFASGSDGILSLYVRKAFVGGTVIIDQKLIDIYASRTTTYGPNPLASIYMAGTITAPQKCVINAGQMVTVDFGNIPASHFATKGQAPTGYTPKTISTAIKCTNVDAYANLTVRFQADTSPSYSSAIKTNNPDVGVIMTDANGKLTQPNSGLIPFKLDSKAEATVTFKATPVSTTGKAPGLGKFTAQAYIRVDFA